MESAGPVCLLVFLSLSISASGDLDVIGKIVDPFLKKFQEKVKDAAFSQQWMDLIGSFYFPIHSTTPTCRNHSDFLLRSFKDYQLWAMRMVDSSSKLSSGILDGNVVDLGSYDECLDVQVPEDQFRGQYCLVEVAGMIPEEVTLFKNIEVSLPDVKINYPMFFVCIPSTCSSEDVMAHFNVFLHPLNASAVVHGQVCSTNEPVPFSLGEWTAIFIIVLLLLLVVVGTIHDYKVSTDKKYFLIAFSLKTNVPKMLNTRVGPDTITCLNGLRVLCLSLIMFCHIISINILYPNVEAFRIFKQLDKLTWSLIESSVLCVDTFLFMSGFLVTYGYLRQRHEGKNIPLHAMCLLRYLRLTPSLAFVMVIAITIGRRIGDGAGWKILFVFSKNSCMERWWNTLLYIHNYTQPRNMCLVVTWYLAADFQLYVFASLLLLIPLYKRPKLGLILTGFSLLMTTLAGYWNFYSNNLRAGGPFTIDFRTSNTILKDHIVTHVRAASFFIGIALGFLISEVRQGRLTLKMSRVNICVGWLISIFLILFSILFVNIFQQSDYVYNPVLEYNYQVLHRHIFSLGLAWIVLMCSLGHGGFVDKFMSWKVFTPLARLSYSAFLVHFPVLITVLVTSRRPGTYNMISLGHEFCGDFILTYLTAAILYLLVECPSSNIIKFALLGRKKTENIPDPASTIVLPDLKDTPQT